MKALHLVYRYDDTYFVDYQTGRLFTLKQVNDRKMHILVDFAECEVISQALTHSVNCHCGKCQFYHLTYNTQL